MWWEMKRKFFVAVLLSASLNHAVKAEPFWWAASYFDPHLRSAQLACEYSASRSTSWADQKRGHRKGDRFIFPTLISVTAPTPNHSKRITR
ncbi:hypothetical protein APA44_33385 [Pseudomonas aeruginosa]|nr:hypothetical protein AO882_32815 [Pseudomonas paraeruginosa]OPE06789.1 hypothetical protein APA44_33385 [Pseudomonas aeruginosa]